MMSLKFTKLNRTDSEKKRFSRLSPKPSFSPYLFQKSLMSSCVRKSWKVNNTTPGTTLKGRAFTSLYHKSEISEWGSTDSILMSIHHHKKPRFDFSFVPECSTLDTKVSTHPCGSEQSMLNLQPISTYLYICRGLLSATLVFSHFPGL